jgi:probable F420-dependent oxidoreductase
VGLERLRGIDPGQVGVFAGPLAARTADEQREVVGEMERLGFGALWYGESTAREVFGQGAIYLCASERLVLASGIASIWARDPTAMAAGGRTLNEAWPKRFILGLGVSHAPMVSGRGHSYERPVARMREYLEGMEKGIWRGPESAEPAPVVLAALGPKMVELAGERAAGAFPYFTTPEHVRSIRERLGPEPFIAVDIPIALAGERLAARRLGDRHMGVYLRIANYVNSLRRLGFTDADLELPGSDALFDAVVAWGSEAEIARRMRDMREAGADHVVLNLIPENPAEPYLPELRAVAPIARAAGLI